ncbi:MAG: hypothetical protein IPP66_21030 [Anaerolineales bacterium]|nr:hypothetical protein [Anaerolineales bacterium]
MKKVFMGLITLLFLMTACAPATPEQPPQSLIVRDPTARAPKPTPTPIPVDLTPAQQAAVSALSETLSLPADQITLISTEAVTWPDGCLGVQRMGMMCSQALVEGFKIILEADGKQYEFHTNQNGSAAVLAKNDTSGQNSVDDIVIEQLANNLGLNKEDITVLSSVDTEFNDACMGVPMLDLMCAQVITPGRIIVLEANGAQYEYHTSADGSRVQPATLALTWKREGGIAGFCDNLVVFLSGEVYGNQCKANDGRMGTFANLLSVAERKQFSTWTAKYGQVNVDASDPKGVADGMTVLLSLYGNGTGRPSKDDNAAILLWAQTIYQKLYE